MSETPAVYQASAIPAASEWAAMKDMAEQLHKSGFMPDAVKTPMQALAVIQQGRELGLPPMFSLRNIFVIGGKPALNSQAIAAIIKQRVHPDAITVEETTDDHCTVSYWRPTWKVRRQFTFSLADAKRAGLLEGNNAHTWRRYPRNMLQARAISGVGIMEYQDVLGGIYNPEELGAAVDMDATGAITVTVMPTQETQPPSPTELAQNEHAALLAHYKELVEALPLAGLQAPGPLPSPISNKAIREINERLSNSLARKQSQANAHAEAWHDVPDAEAEQMALASDAEARP